MTQIIEVLRTTMESVKSSYFVYWGVAGNAVLFLCALLYLGSRRKEDGMECRQEHGILWLMALASFIILCPVSAWFIIRYCVDLEVYRRMFWMLPVPVLIGYAGSRILSQDTRKKRKWLRGLALCGVLILGGTNLYTGAAGSRVNNPYKIWNGVVGVCDVLEEERVAQGKEEIRLVGVDEFIIQARQYNGKIHMPYGRNAPKGSKLGKKAKLMYDALKNVGNNAEALAFYAKKWDYEYLVYYSDEGMVPVLEEAGYELWNSQQEFYIYKLRPERVSDILVSQYGLEDGNQQMFYTVETMKGKLIVIDGGFEADADKVREVLKWKGNHVAAWIITHFHQDHAGAFCNIYENPRGIKIKKIYTVDMAPMELCAENAPWDETDTYQRFLDLDVEVTRYLHAGDNVKIAGMPIKVLNAYDDYVDELSNDLENDGSLMFQIYGQSERMLFCSDVGKSMSDYLVKKYGKRLKSDYVQMGHHGNGGPKADFYEKVGAGIAFFDAPRWLFDNSEGTYRTQEKRDLMCSLGTVVYSFQGAPHSVQLH